MNDADIKDIVDLIDRELYSMEPQSQSEYNLRRAVEDLLVLVKDLNARVKHLELTR